MALSAPRDAVTVARQVPVIVKRPVPVYIPACVSRSANSFRPIGISGMVKAIEAAAPLTGLPAAFVIRTVKVVGSSEVAGAGVVSSARCIFGFGVSRGTVLG